jgi:hypothetical protein
MHAIPVVVDEKLAPMSFKIGEKVDQRFAPLRHYRPCTFGTFGTLGTFGTCEL